jgi:hypothetical protein
MHGEEVSPELHPKINIFLIGLFPTHHYINHSCDPNAINGVKSWENGVVDARARVCAVKNITAGQQIFISYVNPAESLQTRRELLWGLYGFYCDCFKCKLK